MPDYKIICPYCFHEFSHTAVHFRMETVYDESELNDEGMTEQEVNALPESDRKKRLLQQTNERKPFLSKDDEKYGKFWEIFQGGTTEQSLGRDAELPCQVYQLPIIDPSSPIASEALLVQPGRNEDFRPGKYLIYDGDGMAIAVQDRLNKKSTNRRVCPFCHNPLPFQYGKYPVKFIAVIGVTGSGKTVYISQMLKNMGNYMSHVGITSFFTSDHETNFINANPVSLDKPLPPSTMAGSFSQPMFYDLQKREGNQVVTNTIVIYDIAGEDCQKAADMAKFAGYINHADGIMLLVDPTQLDWAEGEMEAKADPVLVLNTIHGAIKWKIEAGGCSIPVAVCVSKSDTYEDMIETCQYDIVPTVDQHGKRTFLFNATDYNELEKELVKRMNDTLHLALRNNYVHFNYFAFSATGGPTVEQTDPVSGVSGTYLVTPPVPKRIAEPLLWLLYCFGFIHSDVRIRLPEPRNMPDYIEEVSGWGPFKKKTQRPLSEREQEAYWYEERC